MWYVNRELRLSVVKTTDECESLSEGVERGRRVSVPGGSHDATSQALSQETHMKGGITDNGKESQGREEKGRQETVS